MSNICYKAIDQVRWRIVQDIHIGMWEDIPGDTTSDELLDSIERQLIHTSLQNELCNTLELFTYNYIEQLRTTVGSKSKNI